MTLREAASSLSQESMRHGGGARVTDQQVSCVDWEATAYQQAYLLQVHCLKHGSEENDAVNCSICGVSACVTEPQLTRFSSCTLQCIFGNYEWTEDELDGLEVG